MAQQVRKSERVGFLDTSLKKLRGLFDRAVSRDNSEVDRRAMSNVIKTDNVTTKHLLQGKAGHKRRQRVNLPESFLSRLKRQFTQFLKLKTVCAFKDVTQDRTDSQAFPVGSIEIRECRFNFGH